MQNMREIGNEDHEETENMGQRMEWSRQVQKLQQRETDLLCRGWPGAVAGLDAGGSEGNRENTGVFTLCVN